MVRGRMWKWLFGRSRPPAEVPEQIAVPAPALNEVEDLLATPRETLAVEAPGLSPREAVAQARRVAGALNAFEKEVNRVWARVGWISPDDWRDFGEAYRPQLRVADGVAQALLESGEPAAAALRESLALAEYLADAGFDSDQCRREQNAAWLDVEVENVRNWFEGDIPRYADQYDRPFVELTEEQRRAVAQCASANLVVASAGSGKTKMLAARCAWLMAGQPLRHPDLGRRSVNPEEILVLCFANGPVAEMRARLNWALGEDAKRIDIRTFHSLGKAIVEEVGGVKFALHPYVVDGQQDLRDVLTTLVAGACAQNGNFAQGAKKLLVAMRRGGAEAVPVATFGGWPEWQRALRAIELQAVDGTRLGTWEDRQLADGLLGLGLEFVAVCDSDGWPGCLFLVGPPIGDPDPDEMRGGGWERWAADPAVTALWVPPTTADGRFVVWARFGEVSARRRERCASVFEVNWTDLKDAGTLEWVLERQAEKRGWTIDPNAFLRRRGHRGGGRGLDRLGQNLASCVQTSKAQLITAKEMEKRLQGDALGRLLWPVAREIMGRYEHMLAAGVPAAEVTTAAPLQGPRRTGDYADLLRFAADLVDRYPARWKHVLVDEYQDTVPGAEAVLDALWQGGATLCCVGDDWQSIYGFAGADVGVVQRFSAKYGGEGSEVALTQSFRCRPDVVGVAADFVTANPAQKVKPAESALESVSEPGVVLLLPGRRMPASLRSRKACLDQALALCPDDAKSALVLSRYRGTLGRWGLDAQGETEADRANVARLRSRFGDEWAGQTMHAAKGAEADFVVLMDVVRGRWGFPSEKREAAVVELLQREAEDFPYASERRLMYVGLTRTRGRVVILASARPSRFVEELALDTRVHLECWGAGERTTGKCGKCSRPLVRAYGLALRWCPSCGWRHAEDAGELADSLGAAGARFR